MSLNKAFSLGIATLLIVSAAVVLTWMLASGPWSGSGDSLATSEATGSEGGFDGELFPPGLTAPEGFGADSALGLTFTDEDLKSGQEFGQSEEPANAVAASAAPIMAISSDQRQIISQGSMSIEVPDVSIAAARVRAIAEGVGGFVEQLSSNGIRELQQSTMTVRVPQAEFFSVFEQIKALGEVQNENAGTEDVTERFIDLEARLKSVQREELSLLSLLDRAQQISEILIIERELTRIRSELERLQGQLNFLERRVDMSAITVFLAPPQKDDGQSPSGSFTIESSDVGGSVDTIKAVVGQVDGEVDRVFTATQDGRQRALMTVRVFDKDFGLLVAAVEDQGGLVFKEVREGKAGDADSEEPSARLDITFQEKESSTLGRNLAIFAPLGSLGLIAVLGVLFYGAYRMGARRED
ncbi:MAG: hypothetical protein BZY87_00975 [SAR202 cluster bacterium Io17-Chloro-G6]|nr:MAG: hypothetical protein BZY87_00975 [SAR202 cluster bacterium Io17-Chloro-G6]